MQKKGSVQLKNSREESTPASRSDNSHLKIGDVFTPLDWAEFAVEKFGIFDVWMEGATVFDPTMGEGNLLEALVEYGIKKGFHAEQLPLYRLYGNEMNAGYFQLAMEKFQKRFSVDMKDNFSNADILELPAAKYDIIFGNPPWQNFVDLPANYKAAIKPYFFQYDLIDDAQSLLLGGSRVDIAALVIKKVISDFLSERGHSYFFMPLSLLLNDGASKTFRNYSVNGTPFRMKEVYDFDKEKVFPNIGTRYGLVHFVRDEVTVFPIPFHVFNSTERRWDDLIAKPVFSPADPLSIREDLGSDGTIDSMQPIELLRESTPRQGVNTCGANDVFFFDSYTEISSDLCIVSNNNSREVTLPRDFVFPLLTSRDFAEEGQSPRKWVLLPFRNDGKALTQQQLEQLPELYAYLLSHKKKLEARKGTMLAGFIKRGTWWGLLGVGAYNFFPWKIVWEAYGRNRFTPRLFPGHWQVNQSLQAYIPLRNPGEAESVLTRLLDKRIEEYLISLKMEGTMNWAQPGKVRKFIRFRD